MRLSSLSTLLFAAFAWTASAADEEGEIKSVSVRIDHWLLRLLNNHWKLIKIARIVEDAHTRSGWSRAKHSVTIQGGRCD